MYVSRPDTARVRSIGGAAPAYGLTAVSARTFGQGTDGIGPAARNFLAASGPAHGVEIDTHVLDTIRGTPYRTTMRDVLTDLVARVPGPVDLLVLAYAVPDFELDDIPAITISEAIGGVKAQFGVSDRGSLAPFTALRTAAAFADRQGYARAAVVVADQASLPYTTELAPSQELKGDAAVALLLERQTRQAPEPALGLASRNGLRAASKDEWDAALDSAVNEVLRTAGGTAIHGADVYRIVVGAGVPSHWTPPDSRAEIVRATPGYPCTGVWLDLRPDTGTTLVIEADPVLGGLDVALIPATERLP